MNAPISTPSTQPTKRCFFPLPRFRTASLLWLVVVVSAFFVGRQSDEIGARLANLWSSLGFGSTPYRLIHRPDRSILIIANSPVPRIQVHNPELFGAEPLSATGIRIFPRNRTGVTQLTYWNENMTPVTIAFAVEDGRIKNVKNVSGPEP
jgi:hypothetical protein